MSKLSELTPGDVVENGPGGMRAIFITQAPHPRYPGLQLAIWRLEGASFSYDALHPHQDIGQIVAPPGPDWPDRLERLTTALERRP